MCRGGSDREVKGSGDALPDGRRTTLWGSLWCLDLYIAGFEAGACGAPVTGTPQIAFPHAHL
jgi:hypothetical protein